MHFSTSFAVFLFSVQACVVVASVSLGGTSAHGVSYAQAKAHHNAKVSSVTKNTIIRRPASRRSNTTMADCKIKASKAPNMKSSTKPLEKTSTTSTSKLLSNLFPVAKISSWTTCSADSHALPLSDATFRLFKLLKTLSHPYVSAPDGKKGMKAEFPKGSYTFTNSPQGGLSFYAPGPASVDITTAREVTFGYSVFFEAGFDFQKGGKLPGLYGGDSSDEAVSCSGGRRSGSCWSVRLMWRTNGDGELYTYLPQVPANDKQCNVEPKSECNPTYGASVGRGAFRFTAGKWNTVSQLVRLNTVGQSDGEMELFFEGKSVIKVTGLMFRDTAAGLVRGIQMQTFFGGSDESYASPKDQSIWFSDFSVGIISKMYAKAVAPARRNVTNSTAIAGGSRGRRIDGKK